MSGSWSEANAALLAARGLGDLPAVDAQALLALLHAGTLVEHADPAVMGAFDLGRLAQWRALASGALAGAERERAAIGLLALGHREPVRALLGEGSPALARAWAAWVGEGQGDGEPAALLVDGLRLVPAAPRGEVAIELREPLPARVALRRLRVGRAVLDVELRRRPTGFALRIALAHGPALVAVVAVPARFGPVTVDEVDDLVPPLRFEVRRRHEVVAYG